NVQNALELYFAKNGYYPKGSLTWAQLTNTLTTADIGISQVPQDPLNNSTYKYLYGADTDGTDYVLGAQLEQCDPALKTDTDDTVHKIDCDDNDETCATTDPNKVYCIRP
ncbi:MAG: hypothetical protein GYA31_02590, partial [Parcubacteria group bacterium]|nr:hypothetical protein [Parcubacteria group bacterium]